MTSKMYDSIDDRSALLPHDADDDSYVAEVRGKKKKNNTTSPSGLMINRILIILALAGLVAVSIYLNSFHTQMTQQLSTDEEKIHQLEITIELQERIIERFNESVTNTDVVKKLDAMEKEWGDEREDLLEQLAKTRADVDKELNSTMITLDETVHKAEKEIHQQVDEVKTDFEQYVVHTEDQFSMENNFMVYQLAGTFTLLSCLISMWHMGSHLRRMNEPAIQRKILAILWMCPIYAVTSWLSLVFPTSAGYLAILKDGYEAYIIYQFLSFCIAVLGKGDRNKVIDLLSKQVDHLTPPFRLFPCCCKPDYEDDRVLANAILTQCQAFTMQFVFWRPVTVGQHILETRNSPFYFVACSHAAVCFLISKTIANFLLNKYEYYGLGDNAHDYRAPQFYVTLIQNLSIFIAFAGLLKFYHAVDKDLEWCRPFAKFLCIKGVVFMTFWQGLALTILAETTDVGGGGDADDWAEKSQNFLICLEMLLFSIAHFYCFPVDEWQPGYQANFQKAKFGETLALNDFFADLKLVMASNYSTKSKGKKKRLSDSTDAVEDDEENQNVNEAPDDDNLTSNSSSSEQNANDHDDSEAEKEDPKEAMIKAFVKSAEQFEEEDPETGEEVVAEAQERIGEMLDAMLFLSPRKSNAAGQPKADTAGDETDAIGEDEVGASEVTGLLSGQPPLPIEQNLRPSIFTKIAENMQRNEGINNDEEEKGAADKHAQGEKSDDEWDDI
ncbi:MAG: hypothetical protein SGILL_006757 [Bacillariaceae sp.]